MNKNIDSNPTFSIIIPVYNAEKFLSKCINSILSQSYSQWELILINDGSSDNSSKICDDFKKKDIRIKVIHKSNQGVSSARNSGLDIACGKYICFVDSDDTIDSFLLEKSLAFTKKNIDCIVYGYDRIHNGILERFVLPNKQSTGIIDSDTDSLIFELKQSNLFIPLWNKIYKRSIIEQYKLRNEINIDINEDLIFNQCFFHKVKTLSYINLPLYHYTLFSTSNCLSMRICDPYLLVNIANVIKLTDFQNSKFIKLSQFDKFYYWDFLRTAYINSLLLQQYKRQDTLNMISVFLSQTACDSDYKEYLSKLGKIKRNIYRWKSKHIIYLFHKIYNIIKK